MATFSKKLHLRNTSNVEQTAEIYSTIGEAGDVYISTNVDNINGYIPLTTTSDSAATSGRVTHTNGNTYAIAVSGVPDYGYSRFTSGSGSFTVPSQVTKLRVTCIGGGAGGFLSSGRIFAENFSGTVTHSSGAGGTTTFGSVKANGGTVTTVECKEVCDAADEYGDCYRYDATYKLITQSDGFNKGSGYIGYSSSSFAGGAAVPLTGYDNASYGSYGAGGYSDADNQGRGAYYGGASGFRTISTISVSPGNVIAYTVGAGGLWWAETELRSVGFSSGGRGGGPGSSGAILVEWGKGIQ